MKEFEEWFDVEFYPYGFMLTPTMYSPENFLPFKGMLYRVPIGGVYKTTKIRTTFSMVNFDTFRSDDSLYLYANQIKQQIVREFERCGYYCPWTKSFLPNKTIKKFNFTNY